MFNSPVPDLASICFQLQAITADLTWLCNNGSAVASGNAAPSAPSAARRIWDRIRFADLGDSEAIYDAPFDSHSIELYAISDDADCIIGYQLVADDEYAFGCAVDRDTLLQYARRKYAEWQAAAEADAP